MKFHYLHSSIFGRVYRQVLPAGDEPDPADLAEMAKNNRKWKRLREAEPLTDEYDRAWFAYYGTPSPSVNRRAGDKERELLRGLREPEDPALLRMAVSGFDKLQERFRYIGLVGLGCAAAVELLRRELANPAGADECGAAEARAAALAILSRAATSQLNKDRLGRVERRP